MKEQKDTIQNPREHGLPYNFLSTLPGWTYRVDYGGGLNGTVFIEAKHGQASSYAKAMEGISLTDVARLGYNINPATPHNLRKN
jgi:hypothetical protein